MSDTDAPERAEIMRVAVGGPLHGRVIGVPDGAKVVYSVGWPEGGPLPVSVVSDGKSPLPPIFHAADTLIVYVVAERGPGNATRLIIERELYVNEKLPDTLWGLIRGVGLASVVTDALGIAAGVHREQGPANGRSATLRVHEDVAAVRGGMATG